MVYSPGQALDICHAVTATPAWLILGGPADGDDAQVLTARYPGMKVVGFEPCPAAVAWQLENGWRPEWTLLPAGLSDAPGEMVLMVPGDADGARRSSMVRPVGGTPLTVPVTTLDAADAELGPFADAILWIDIEGMEYRALLGARKLLARRAFSVINLEAATGRGDHVRLLASFQYRRHTVWSNQGTHWDEVWVRA